MLATPTQPPTPPPHSLDTDAAETWADAFRTASGLAGTPVDAIVNCDHFSITTLPSYTGPDVHVYSIEGVIVDVNTECATAVGIDGVDMEFSQAEVADATPTNLRRAVERATTSRRSSGGVGRSRPAVIRFPGTPRPSLLPLSPRPGAATARTRSRSPPQRRQPRGLKASPKRSRA